MAPSVSGHSARWFLAQLATDLEEPELEEPGDGGWECPPGHTYLAASSPGYLYSCPSQAELSSGKHLG